MDRDEEIEHFSKKQAEDFTLLDRAAVRLGGYGLSLETVDLDRDGRTTTYRFSLQGTVIKTQEKIDTCIEK